MTSSPLTREKDFYAKFIISKALRLRTGQALHLVRAPQDAAEFVDVLDKTARESGASEVFTHWDMSDAERRNFAARGDCSREGICAPHEVDRLVTGAARGDAFVLFDCTCAGIFDGMNHDSVLQFVMAEGTALAPLWRLLSRNQATWTMITVPTVLWAKKMYPGHTPEEGEQLLWKDIFAHSRINITDPAFTDWERHILALERAAAKLNKTRFDALHFTAPGTDLTVGLADGHIWLGPVFRTAEGRLFTPNVPMDEIFTAPHRLRTEGTAQSTRPVVLNGVIIEDLRFSFQDGRIVDADARKGADLLQAILRTDEGSCRLGEVALVPSEEGGNGKVAPLYFTTLFDENASSHLALGRAYAVTVESKHEDDDFLRAGGNLSALHVDFTIGSDSLNVDGLTKDGQRTAILRGSRWVLDSREGRFR